MTLKQIKDDLQKIIQDIELLEENGHVYLIQNPLTGNCKIGYTKRTVEERINDYTNLDFEFIIRMDLETSNPVVLEALLHSYFSEFRVSDDNEWFKFDDVYRIIGLIYDIYYKFESSGVELDMEIDENMIEIDEKSLKKKVFDEEFTNLREKYSKHSKKIATVQANGVSSSGKQVYRLVVDGVSLKNSSDYEFLDALRLYINKNGLSKEVVDEFKLNKRAFELL